MIKQQNVPSIATTLYHIYLLLVPMYLKTSHDHKNQVVRKIAGCLATITVPVMK